MPGHNILAGYDSGTDKACLKYRYITLDKSEHFGVVKLYRVAPHAVTYTFLYYYTMIYTIYTIYSSDKLLHIQCSVF